ncbi:DNA sulfur modification protein DndD [Filimonas lacunae]|uniref:DNA sulfur modification protein DndD n=1 Tax=Filimonas lacunae TaxID=477680 RepID=A0A173MJN5_9BACT|nr:AAA family ATPase [Filimonas lacunae]BAV07710.1 exonuclease SbcC [Filimonas lacunae]SIT03864.1 DNA sulfur modification protein DndD [Filimonas lacunae]
MIIKKIELDNFMCYAGNGNCIEFSEGINVIIGDNGYGKSKLYDAFYWVMHDQVFSPEKKAFETTKSAKANLISDKAKAEIENGRLSAAVKITFHNLEKDSVYILERRYSITVTDGKIQEDNDGEFTIMEKELSYLNARMVTDVDRKRMIVNSILPPQIKDYLWFQGEQVESIIDFNQKDTLTKAVNVLSNISRYDSMIEIAEAAAKAAAKEYDTDLRRLSKDSAKSAVLETRRLELEKKIYRQKEEEREVSDNLARAEARCEELLNKQADAKKVSVLQERKRGVVGRLELLNKELKKEQVNFHRKMFHSHWVLKGTEDMLKLYANKFSEYEKKKLLQEAEEKVRKEMEDEVDAKLQTRLPINVPEPNYVEWMLEKERCLVCDREAKKETEAWLKIKELLDRPKEKKKASKEVAVVPLDFSGDLKSLYQNGVALESRIEDIDSDINDALQQRSNLQGNVREVNKEMGAIELDIQRLLADTALTSEGAENILNEYSIQNKKAKDFKDDWSRITHDIAESERLLKEVNDERRDLVTGALPAWLVEKKEVTSDFEIIAKTTRDRVFNNLITQLEQEANKHYQDMTLGNKSARGIIKLRKQTNGNYMPEIIDSNGNPLLGLNTSNIILVKLSAIMAIISAKGNSGDLYTLITDAPTSVFGEDYTIGFCKTISKVYQQSIIMSKEFYKNQELKNELLKNPDIKIGRVYTITPSIVEGERADRSNLSTKIEALN